MERIPGIPEPEIRDYQKGKIMIFKFFRNVIGETFSLDGINDGNAFDVMPPAVFTRRDKGYVLILNFDESEFPFFKHLSSLKSGDLVQRNIIKTFSNFDAFKSCKPLVEEY